MLEKQGLNFRLIISIIGFLFTGYGFANYINNKECVPLLLIGIFFEIYCIYFKLEIKD